MDIDLFDKSLLADPYRILGELRDETPMFWSQKHRVWILLSYPLIKGALRRHEDLGRATTAKHAKRGKPPTLFQQVQAEWFIQKDPPVHTELRRFFGSYFTPGRIRVIEDQVDQLANKLIDAVIDRGEMDFVADFAYLLPSIVISNFLGAPESDIHLYKKWSSALTAVQELDRTDDDVRRADVAAAESQDYFRALLLERAANPRDDIISYALAERDEEALPDDILMSNLFLLLSAGHETTINLLSNAMIAFIDFPDEWRKLQADSGLTMSATEEALRFDGPVHLTGRVAYRDLELGGHDVREGQGVIMFLGAANRDPVQFDRPEDFVIDRSPNPHVAFGYGIHHCMGAPLARLETRMAFQALATKIDHPVLAGPPQRLDTLMTRGITSLPLKIKAR